MANKRVEQQPAFVLHSHPWRETSYVVDVLSRDHGRVALVAKGARRPRSALRGVLLAFQPLDVSWSGSGELKTLVAAEWSGGQPMLSGSALMCGYYANELLVRLLPREDPHPGLFDGYAALLAGLSRGEPQDQLLRSFELSLLSELGYAPTFDTDEQGLPVRPEAFYVFIIERGPVLADREMQGEHVLSGRVLLDLARSDLSNPETLLQAKTLMRRLIGNLVGARPLESRRIFLELQEL
ncbi:DNA repair protein RecO [Niveibacterium umoris]|uniref:DNA repair protein RecO n=1 Tax=Niveibacterium umoris TaxID=1193620 RepID=A0A840BGW0_9RHOO|nr:DNA repair protein RecO [Niveibacterium umoris]MBB4010908.1 DNA repair protein RecO (recombination protein O) [Niveibacterium umoris]